MPQVPQPTYPVVSITPDDEDGGGGGASDHRVLTHRNDADQHTGDAVKVTATWPGDASPSDKTLTAGTAAILESIGSASGGGASLFPFVRQIRGNIPLTNALWSMFPSGSYMHAADQTTPSENGIYVTNGTTTLASVPTPTGPFVLDAKEVYATFADVPSNSTQGTTYLFPAGTDLVAMGVPGDDFSILTIASYVKVGTTPDNYTPVSDSVLGHLQGIDAAIASAPAGGSILEVQVFS